ncbi:nucleotidyltransferase family protein [Swingsia samuiensis]|uniref:Nucleotidyltransferase family protein n=1 Tax=Swingsia samuiensis TaxID=1293412 RepID=A0A4Y6UJU9_9PROT|nr:NTP transferase domain-containing protein [Swingsia samuiensis]QDH17334.1 nucleotidyltransferase family protein [Swingsia samuiensis]
MNIPPHNIILLAAGESKRLGYPKQLLTSQGRPLVEHIARIAFQTQPNRLLIITGAYKERIEEAVKNFPTAEIIYNPAWKTGLSSSLQCAAQSLGTTNLPTLILTTDQFRLTKQHLLNLLLFHPQNCNVMTEYSSNLSGIPARITPATLTQTHTLNGDQGFKKILQSSHNETIRAPELLHDLDRPEDVKMAIQAGWLDTSNYHAMESASFVRKHLLSE